MDQATATLIAGVAAAAGSTAVGVTAIFFAWRNTRATLRQERVLAADARLWSARDATHQQIADWLVAHPLVGSQDPLYEPNLFSAWTFDPGPEIDGRAQILATEAVAASVRQIRALAYEENKIAHAATLVASYAAGGGAFEESELSRMFGWTGPADAHQKLSALRESWNAARTKLLTDLRDAYVAAH
jgi:hypothetical protein